MKKFIYIVICMLAILFGGCQNQGMQYVEEESQMADTSEADSEDVSNEEESSSGISDAEKEAAPTVEVQPNIFVYVCGAVNQPGVYELPANSRAVHAITAAGGLLENAAGDYVNQAKVLEDGEQLTVPTIEETANMVKVVPSGTTGDTQPGGSGLDDSKIVNINQADAAELQTLNGIGEVKAQAIISYRQEHGGFQSVEEIKKVDGIGDGIYNKIRDSIEV